MRLLDHAVGDHAGRADQEGVAVGRALGDHVGAQRRAGARLVLDDHRLAQRLARRLRRRRAPSGRWRRRPRTARPADRLVGQAACAAAAKARSAAAVTAARGIWRSRGMSRFLGCGM